MSYSTAAYFALSALCLALGLGIIALAVFPPHHPSACVTMAKGNEITIVGPDAPDLCKAIAEGMAQ